MILLVQPDDVLAATTAETIGDAGLGPVLRAATGREALGQACRAAVAVVEWSLPDMAGAAFAAAAAALGAARPHLLVLTAGGDPHDAVAALQAGADDHLARPFHPAELVARVRAGLRLRALAAELAGEAARHRAVLETATDAIIVSDESGVIESANPACERLLGHRPADLVGRPLALLMPDADARAHQGHVDRYLAGGRARIIGIGREVVARHRDGRPVPVHLAVSEMVVDGRRRFCGVLRDLSALRAAEAERRDAEVQFRLLAENASDIISRLAPDGRMLYVSPACEAILGFAPADLAGRQSWADLAHPADRPALEAAHAALLAGEPRSLLVHRHRTASGGWVWLETAWRAITGPGGRVVEVQADSREVGARVRAEAEQRALRRVAMAVAGEPEPDAVAALVAREMAALDEWEAAAVVRVGGRGEAVAVAAEGPGVAAIDLGGPGEGPMAELIAGRAPVVSMAGGRVLALTPVAPRGRLWGAVAVVAAAEDVDGTERLAAFANLLATAVANAEARAQLLDRAARDPLTGLLNHRSLHERLEETLRVDGTSGRETALAIIDVDHFKQMNDHLGHQVGDRVLAEVARRLAACARSGEALGRIGGDEIAWVIPGADARAAASAVERARRAVGGRSVPGAGRIQVSAGVVTTAHAAGAAELLRLADGALYWAKANGRDRVCVYHPDVVVELSAHERVARLERTRALVALRALARAVDAKDPSTRRHSERVAEIAEGLAGALGWAPRAVQRLHEAALLHDVGKIGLPDAILTRRGRLTEAEYAQVTVHPALGAEIVSESLDAEQTAWVRHHHERWDGGGYPDGLGGTDIPEGARILALADALEVMTGDERPYRDPLAWGAALQECLRCSGTQFWPAAVQALARLRAAGWEPGRPEADGAPVPGHTSLTS